MYTQVASLCLPRSCLLGAAFPSRELRLSESEQTTLAFFQIRGAVLFNPGIVYLDALSRRLLRYLCTVSHECNTPHLNTDIDMVVCYYYYYSFFNFFYDSFFPLFLPVRFTDHTLVSFWERKLMTTRHALGRIVLEIVPQ